MEKKFYANIEYNKKQRNNAFILGSILIALMILFVVFLITSKNYSMLPMGAIVLIIPFVLIPSVIKTNPIDGREIISVEEKEVIINKETIKIKDIEKIKVSLKLPASKLESENKKTLEEISTVKLDDIYLGDFDITYKGTDGKLKVAYSTIDHVIDCLDTFLRLGIKNYQVSFTIKKNTKYSTYDFRRDIALEKEKESNELKKLSKKEKMKQLI